MKSTILGVAALAALAAAFLPALAPADNGRDRHFVLQKKEDKDKDKDKDKKEITAATEIGGKNLDQWIALIHDKDRSQTEVAIKTILTYPPDVAKKAVPEIIKELKKHTKVAPIDMSVRVNGTLALGLILSSAKNPDQTQVNETVALLKKMLSDEQILARFRACQALAQMGTMAKDAIPELAKATKDPETWEVRQAAVNAMGPVAWEEKDPPNEKAIDALIDRLKDSAIKVRMAAMSTLQNLRTAEHKDYLNKYFAALSTMALEDSNVMCRLRANLSILAQTKDADVKKSRVARIADFLLSKDIQARGEALATLAAMAADAKDKEYCAPAIPKLRTMANDDADPTFRIRANVALVALIKAADRPARVMAVVAFLDDKDAGIRSEAMQALTHLLADPKDKDSAKAAIPALNKIAENDADPSFRIRAHMAVFPQLPALDKKGRVAIIAKYLDHADANARTEAAQALGHLNHEAKDAIPQLAQAVTKNWQDKDYLTMGWCMWALAHMESDAKSVVPLLDKVLADLTVPDDVRDTAKEAHDVITGKIKLKGDDKKDTKKGGDKK
jgi:uncharacterized protein (UPF0147 family)